LADGYLAITPTIAKRLTADRFRQGQWSAVSDSLSIGLLVDSTL
jgi:hypothetical protein